MIFIGIDIAKSTHFASAVNSDGEVLINPFKFTNDNQGFNLFINTFKDFDLSNCLVGLESTGIYGDNLTTFLLKKVSRLVVLIQFKLILFVLLILEKLRMIRLNTFLIAQCLMLGHYTLITEKIFSLSN